jgi:hypothetical protein
MFRPVRVRGLGVIALMAVACLGNETIASSVLDTTEDGWHTWRVPAAENSEAPEIQIYVLIEAGRTSKISLPGSHCHLVPNTEIPNAEIRDLGSVSAEDSIDWLRPHIKVDSDIASDALAAISRHSGNYAFQVLAEVVESDADRDFREEAIFWMVVSENEDAFAYIDRLIMGD